MQQLPCYWQHQLLEFPLKQVNYNVTGSSTMSVCCTELNAIKLLYGCLIVSTIESVVYDPHLPSLCQIIVMAGSLKLQIPLKRCFLTDKSTQQKCL